VISGNRKVLNVCLLVAGISFSASEARAPAIPQVLVAPEFAARSEWVLRVDCPAGEYAQRIELRFEMIKVGDDVDLDTLRALLSRASRRTLDFDWDPDRGELSIHKRAELTRPADRRTALAAVATSSCTAR
jgi:hypothetical protein